MCNVPLSPPTEHGERLCERCASKRKPPSRVYMHFMLREDWYCQFLEEDLKTPLPRKVTIKDPEKIYEMAERGGYSMNLEGRKAIDRAIETGRGGIWLNLTDDQLAALKRR